MKIMIICQWFPPEYAPVGVMLKELAEDLTKSGYSVTVVTGFPNHPAGTVFEGYRKRLFFTERMDGIRVIRCYLYTSPRKTFLRRVANYFSFAATSFAAALVLQRQDLLFIVSPPLSNGLIALLLHRLKGLRFIFNVQDLYPDAAMSVGVIRNRLLIKILKRIELAIYRGAERVAVISEGFKENLLAKGVPDPKIRIIYNWLDACEIVPLPRDNEFARAHGLTGKFVILYSGTIGMISGAEIIIECAETLKTYRDILFLFVGEGVAKEAISEKARSTGLDNIRFLAFQPRNILSQVQSSADVSVVTLSKGKGKTSVPSKVLGYMAAARPVVASVDPDSDTRQLIERAGCGICVDPEDVQELSLAIESLYHDRGKASLLGRRGREFLISNWDRKIITSHYERLLAECCKG
jgi:colanic acid biosynthesis glycosyl transferase WcaI